VEWASRDTEDDCEFLKDKIQSKVAVSTFLTGFFIAALVELVKDPGNLCLFLAIPCRHICQLRRRSVLRWALGLLLAAVYTYGQLSMPHTFWRPDAGRQKAEDRWPPRFTPTCFERGSASSRLDYASA
jgi:hypothetical protein